MCMMYINSKTDHERPVLYFFGWFDRITSSYYLAGSLLLKRLYSGQRTSGCEWIISFSSCFRDEVPRCFSQSWPTQSTEKDRQPIEPQSKSTYQCALYYNLKGQITQYFKFQMLICKVIKYKIKCQVCIQVNRKQIHYEIQSYCKMMELRLTDSKIYYYYAFVYELLFNQPFLVFISQLLIARLFSCRFKSDLDGIKPLPLGQVNIFCLNRISMIKERSLSAFNKYRKWQKVVEPLVKYDRQRSQFGYPLTFFYQLQQHISGGYPLALNIATTLTGAKDNSLKTVFEKNQEVGNVVFSPAILKSAFDADIERQMQERLTKFCERDLQFAAFYVNLKQTNACDQMLPWAVIKQKEAKGECRVITHSRDQYKKVVNLEANQVAQCFIWGSGKQASIIRFFYFPYKQNSEAFKIDNLQGFMKKSYGKGHFKVRQNKENSLTFVKIMYTNKSFYQQSLNLVQFLQKHQKIKISKIVTDWILDPHNRYFLIDVKQLTFTKAQALIKIRHSLSDVLAYLSCAVCQQKFREQEVTKTLTDRLIIQFFEHLKKRQIYLSFTPPAKPNSNLSRLCQQCYMLVVSQSQLMQLEKQIAKITHSIKPAHSLTSNPIISSKGQLFQWRLFFFLEDIKDLLIQDDPKASYFIMIRIHNSTTSFKLKNTVQKYQLIKGIKIHYLFSESQKIDKFLSNSQIIIRITKGNNWNSVQAQGSTSGLYEQSEKHSMRKFKQILVFNKNSKYSVLGIHIGIKRQGKYDPSHLALQKAYDVYMVEDGYSNCYALPAEWMETIDPSYCIAKSQSTSFSYSLHLGAAEKKSLLPTLPKQKKKLAL